MPTKTLTIELLRRVRAALHRGHAVKIQQQVVLMHPDTHMAIRRADARAHWYQQHRANRIAKRTGQPAEVVARQFTSETGEAFGIRIVMAERAAP